MARRVFFVTGTDTEVGKTVVAASLLEAARNLGWRTLAVKPVASGCEETEDGLRNGDALALQSAITESLDYQQINPIALEPAIAPHIAAREAGVQLSARRLEGLCRAVTMQPGDFCLIEGAGGWRVPLNDRETFADLVRALQIPVLMVVPLRLGCINHAMLTAQTIRADGLPLAGWIANRPQADAMSREADNLRYLHGHLPAPCLGELPWLAEPDPKLLSRELDLGLIGGRG